MPKFTVEANSSQPPQETFNRLKEFLTTDADLHRMDSKLNCRFDEATMTGEANGSQFKASLKVTPQGSGATVAVTVDLPFALSLFKGKIQQVLEKKLQSTLA